MKKSKRSVASPRSDLTYTIPRLPSLGPSDGRMWLRAPAALVADLEALRVHYAPSWSRNKWLVILLGKLRDELQTDMKGAITAGTVKPGKMPAGRKMGTNRGK